MPPTRLGSLEGPLSGKEPTGWEPAPGTQPAHSRRSAVGGRGFSAPLPVPAAPTPPPPPASEPRFLLPHFPPHTAAGPPRIPPYKFPHKFVSMGGVPLLWGGGRGARGWSDPCLQGLSGGGWGLFRGGPGLDVAHWGASARGSRWGANRGGGGAGQRAAESAPLPVCANRCVCTAVAAGGRGTAACTRLQRAHSGGIARA